MRRRLSTGVTSQNIDDDDDDDDYRRTEDWVQVRHLRLLMTGIIGDSSVYRYNAVSRSTM